MEVRMAEEDINVHTPRGLLVSASDLVTKDVGQVVVVVGDEMLSVLAGSDGKLRVRYGEDIVFERDFSKEAVSA
jgi:hypothetical protein